MGFGLSAREVPRGHAQEGARRRVRSRKEPCCVVAVCRNPQPRRRLRQPELARAKLPGLQLPSPQIRWSPSVPTAHLQIRWSASVPTAHLDTPASSDLQRERGRCMYGRLLYQGLASSGPDSGQGLRGLKLSKIKDPLKINSLSRKYWQRSWLHVCPALPRTQSNA